MVEMGKDGTGVVAVRLGPLRPQLETLCEILGIERSEYIRRAIEEKMEWTELIDMRALCAGAVLACMGLINSCARGGLIKGPLANQLVEMLDTVHWDIREQLQKVYETKFPVAAQMDREDLAKWKSWKSAGEKGPEPRFRESPDGGHRWKARVERCLLDSFPDLQRANAYIRRANGENVEYAPAGFWRSPNEGPSKE
jgi:hypothetical protein